MSDPDLSPVKASTDLISGLGVLAWLVALVVVALVPALHAADRWWWPWCCAAGVVLGLLGWGYLRLGRGNAAHLDE